MIDRIASTVAVVMLIGTAAVVSYGLYVLGAERDSLRAERDALRIDIATQRAGFEAEARRQEREQHLALAGIRSIFDREMEDANAEHDRVVDGLRADALRLRQHWQGCTATAELSATVAAAARADEDAELRARGAADLVRLGAECDARIHGLQSAVRVYSGGAP